MSAQQDYYTANVRAAATDYAAQVGHTVNGQSVDEATLAFMTAQMAARLEIGPDDVLLELCCGNGLFTRRLAESARSVVAMDVCQPLIDIARQVHDANNILYYQGDALSLSEFEAVRTGRFSRVLMNAALQHFSPKGLHAILSQLSGVITKDAVLLFGFVPDRAQKWRFYNTSRRVLDHLLRRLMGKERIDHWWRRRDVEAIARIFGLECSFLAIPGDLPGSAYRFDIVMKRSAGS